MNCRTMSIVIEDTKKINFQSAKTEEEKLRLLAEKDKDLTFKLLKLINQIILADGYKIKVIDLREKK
jgi:hypothetical protein